MSVANVLAGGIPWYGLVEQLTWAEKSRIFELAGYKPHRNQEIVHRSTSRMRIVVCGRRFGKSTLAAYEAIAVAALGGRVWTVGPDYDLASIVFEEAVHAVVNSELVELLARAPRTAKGQQLLQFKNGGWIVGKSSIKPRSLVGRGLDLIVFDECAKEANPEVWYANLRPALTDRRGGLLAITTPMGDDWVKSLWMQGDAGMPGYESFRLTSYSNPLLDPREIDAARLEVPDATFRQEYLAEFLDAEGAVFTGYRDVATAELQDEPTPGRSYVMGVDLARYEDWTVLTIMDALTRSVVAIHRTNNTAWSTQRALINSVARRWNYADVIIDSTGVGDPIREEVELMSGGDYTVEGYVFTAVSKQQLINQTVVAIQQKEIELPNDQTKIGRTYLAEIGSYRYTRTDAGTLKMGAPPGRHDDCPISLCLAVEALMRYSPRPPMPYNKPLEEEEPEKKAISGSYTPPRAPNKRRPSIRGRFGRE